MASTRSSLVIGGFALFAGVFLAATTACFHELRSAIMYDPNEGYHSDTDDDRESLDSETFSVV